MTGAAATTLARRVAVERLTRRPRTAADAVEALTPARCATSVRVRPRTRIAYPKREHPAATPSGDRHCSVYLRSMML
jgi:hypothetical protein